MLELEIRGWNKREERSREKMFTMGAEISHLRELNKTLGDSLQLKGDPAVKKFADAFGKVQKANRTLQESVNEHIKKSEEASNERDIYQIRNESLADLIRKNEEEKDKLLQGFAAQVGKLKPDQARPLPRLVKGKVEKVETNSNGMLEVRVSLGKEHGIEAHQSLEIFRLEPRPEYLGTIVVIDAYQGASYCRQSHAAKGDVKLMTGDVVIGTVTPP